jgi:hypothetical protein
MNKNNSFLVRWTLAALMLGWLFSNPAIAMDLGTNFWNIRWHNPDDCFRDVQKVSGEDPWNPQFLKEIAIYNSLRFMDWNETNNTGPRPWQQRTHKDAAMQAPVAYEWMIDLCNRVNADMWVTLPHTTIAHTLGDAPSDYALRLCILVKTGVDMRDADLSDSLKKELSELNAGDFIAAGGVKTCDPLKPNLKLYVEYSNETWNGMFKQSHYCCDEGEALKLGEPRWTAGFRYHAWAAIRLFRAADLVFGVNSDRVIKVLATHTGNSWVVQQHIAVMNDPKSNPWKVKADAIATAPYFGHKVVGDSPNAVEELRADIRKSAEQSANHKEIADKNGMALIAYEGGQHVLKKADVINRDPAMYTLYCEYLQEMSKYFSHFSHYCHVGQAESKGCWGCIEQTGQSVSEAHKYRALAEWASKNGSRNAAVKKTDDAVKILSPAEQKQLAEKLGSKAAKCEITYDAEGNVTNLYFSNHQNNEKEAPGKPGIGDEEFVQLVQFPKLKGFMLETQQVSDEGLKVLKQMPNLEEARFHYMDKKWKLAGQPDRITADFILNINGCRKLKALDIKHNFTLKGTSIDKLDGFPELEWLMLDNAAAGPKAVPFLLKCPKIKTLHLHRTTLGEDDFAKAITALPNIEEIWIRPDKVGKEIALQPQALRHLGQLKNLKVIKIGGQFNYFPLPYKNGLEYLAAIPTLKQVDFPVKTNALSPGIAEFIKARSDVAISFNHH